MKQFILIAFTLMLFGCEERKQVYETEVKTYVISEILVEHHVKSGYTYVFYFQTSTSTECADVSEETYNKYKVGDTIQVLIKYWEKTKKK
jgi:hypothetical protein